MALLVIFMALQRELFQKNKEKLVIILMTLLFAVYISAGGELFKTLEGPQEDVGHSAILKAISNVKSKYPGIPDAAINDLFHQMTASGVKGLPDGGKPTPKWTFGNAVLFSITLLTTIGYGHLSPLTAWGKVATIGYTAVGIPLTLVMMSLYVCRLTTLSKSYKAFLFRKLKGPMTPVQINFIHITSIMILILFGCFLIPALIFDYLEESWTFLDSLYYCFISLTTVGLGDYVPALNTQSPYVDLYRIGSGVFILYGVIVMMFMLTLTSDFYNHCYEDIPLPVTVHTDKIPIHTDKIPIRSDKFPINSEKLATYGTITVNITDEQRLLES